MNKFYHHMLTILLATWCIYTGIWFLLDLSVFNCLQTTYKQVSVASHKITKTHLFNNDNTYVKSCSLRKIIIVECAEPVKSRGPSI